MKYFVVCSLFLLFGCSSNMEEQKEFILITLAGINKSGEVTIGFDIIPPRQENLPKIMDKNFFLTNGTPSLNSTLITITKNSLGKTQMHRFFNENKEEIYENSSNWNEIKLILENAANQKIINNIIYNYSQHIRKEAKVSDHKSAIDPYIVKLVLEEALVLLK